MTKTYPISTQTLPAKRTKRTFALVALFMVILLQAMILPGKLFAAGPATTPVSTAANPATAMTGSITGTTSSDASLSAIALTPAATLTNTGTTGSTTTYTTTVSSATTAVTVTPTTTDPNATVKVNGVPVTSGTASASIALGSEGTSTIINTVVTAQDGTTTMTYSITITRAPSNDPLLTHISISSGTLKPVTGSPNYTVSVANGITSVTVSGTIMDPNAYLTINGTPVASNTPSAPIPLSVGANAINLVITAQNGVAMQTYVVTVTRAPSSNALLSEIHISAGALTPVTGTPDYTATVITTSTTVTATTTDPTATMTVNGTAVTSGTASAAIPLAVGSNTISVVVTAQDGSTTQTYTLTITRLSNNALLSHISISSGTLKPVTGSPNYTVNVVNGVTSFTVTPTTADPNATVTVNGTTVTSGTASAAIPLSIGANTITIVVTAQDGVTTQPYVVTVTRAASNNALLSHISISSGTLTPVKGSPNFTVSVANATTSVTVTPTTADATATVTVNSTVVVSGTASGAIPLSVGSNIINIVVTAQDGTTTQPYVITVTRAQSSNALLSEVHISPGKLTPVTGTPNFTATVTSSTKSITVTATTADPTASFTVNGVPEVSGVASAAIGLNVGSNTISVVVTAQDGVTTHTYVITVSKPSNNALLSHIFISSGTLKPVTGSPNFTVSETNDITSVTVTANTADPNSTVTINGAAVASGAASAAISLAVGSNTINIVVTAQDGVTTQPYVITVTRAPSSVATLSNLAISSGTLTPVSGTPNYTASVTSGTASITVTPTTTDPTATVTVNSAAVASGTASAAIPLSVGSNTINVVVTAQDGTTTQAYVITVTKPSNNTSLSSLSINPGTLTAVSGTSNFTANVSNATTSTSVTATLADPNATVTVNGAPEISGDASGAIGLSVGSNTITVAVTAQDGVTTQSYVITVTRAASSDALLTHLAISSGTLTPVSGSPNYTDEVTNATTSVTVRAITSDPNATLTINGTTVASGTASAPISLAVGSNTINIVVTAQDGVTTQPYVITVTRDAGPLMSLSLPSQSISVTKPTDNLAIENDGVMVHQGVSPNGDGINDVLTIDGITAYPNNSLTIVDRNGSLIFRAKGYDNSLKAFDGHSSVNGRMLQTGTYFYSLDYIADGQNKHKTGFILLKY